MISRRRRVIGNVIGLKSVPTIFALSGSLRIASSNSALVRFFHDRAPESCLVDVSDGLAELPHLNPDEDVASNAGGGSGNSGRIAD